MKTAIVVLLNIVFFSGCVNGSSTQTSNSEPQIATTPVAEGTVYYFSGGGTREMPYPPGFQLADIYWISPPTDRQNQVYLSGVVSSTHVNRRVRVFGSVTTVTRHGTPSSYVYSYSRITVDSVQIIN